MWTFIPSDVGKFVMKPSLVMWGQGFSSNTSGGKKREFPVRIIGEGAYGSLEVSISTPILNQMMCLVMCNADGNGYLVFLSCMCIILEFHCSMCIILELSLCHMYVSR